MTARRIGVLIAAIAAVLGSLYALHRLAEARTVQLFGRIVPRAETAERRVALTFDDGPTPGPVDSLLGLLARRGVRATFFVTGRELAQRPELGRRLAEAGHELGNHSYSHRRMTLVSPGFVRAEIERTDSLVRAAGYRGEIYFRPPYGYKLAVLPWYLARAGRTTVTWDVEPDSHGDVAATAEGIVRHTLDRVRPGSIILLHVWYPSRATSLAAVGPLIDSLHARGYAVGPVRELLARPPDATTAAEPSRPGIRFDPDTLRPGSRVGDLIVDSIDARRTIVDTATRVGVARFRGELQLTGWTLRHPDPDAQSVCFEADAVSAARLPRWQGDERRAWFCFENQAEARRALGPPSEGVGATVVIDRFTIHRGLSDEVNSARLVRVVPSAAASVVGRWQRIGQPREWLEFASGGTFTGRGYSPSDTTLIRGRFEQRGAVVTGTSVYGHTRRLTLHDSTLVMEDGTRYRRVAPD